MSFNDPNVAWIRCNNYEDALMRASVDASTTEAAFLSVQAFKQGCRWCFSGAITVHRLKESDLTHASVPQNSSVTATKEANNRPLIEDHAAGIKDYLVKYADEKFILPSITLSTGSDIRFYSGNVGDATFVPGVLVIPMGSKLNIVDGQHRKKAILDTLAELTKTDPEKAARFRAQGVAVLIVSESETRQVHQDFSDCSKTKALPPSLIALYDVRNRANGLLVDLEDRVSVFKGKLDGNAKTLTARSEYLFLVNQVRQMVKETVGGNYAMGELDFEKLSNRKLAEGEAYARALETYVEFLQAFTEANPVWSELATAAPPDPSAKKAQPGSVSKRRAEGWIHLTATGLVLIGRVIKHCVSTPGIDHGAVARSLAALDWSRDSALFAGNIVQTGGPGGKGRILTSQVPVRKAFEQIMGALSAPAESVPAA